ncbi:nucleolin-like [Heterodontus francisci]|uniref:nucleolin-like n=1 Tax=Heterodontus francisci TaxID=7792 RepID=UPI00355BCB16
MYRGGNSRAEGPRQLKARHPMMEAIKIRDAQEARIRCIKSVWAYGTDVSTECGVLFSLPQTALQLIVSNLDSSKDFGELQIAVISFFHAEKVIGSLPSVIKKSRKRGHVTFLSGKDLNRAMKYNGEQLLGRALRLRRPQQIWKPVAKVVQGKKRKLKEYDGESMTPSPAKKIVQRASDSTKKDKKAPVSLLNKKKKKQEQTEKTEEEEANPVQKKKKRNREKVVLSGKSKKDEWEDTAVVLQKKKKKSLEKPVLCEKREGNAAPPPQMKKKKHQEKKVSLSKERVEEGEKVASVLQKKKKKNKETLVLSEKRTGKEELTTCPKKKKKKMKKITSWCLYMQKVESQERMAELKIAIGNFLNERSVAYKEIVLYPDSCSVCVELYSEHDLNEALEFDACKIFGQAARLSKVEKLGAFSDGDDLKTLYVKSLPSEVCAKDLKSLFEKVTGVWIQDRQEINKRFAFVTFETTEAAANALSKGEIECKGKLLQLKHAGQRNKGKRKIVMVRNLPCPMSKKYLKSLFNDAVDIQLSKDNQSQGIAYIEYRTAKQAKVALKEFRDKGVPGHAIRIASIESIEERKESPKSKSDDSVPISSLFIWGLSNKTTVKMLRSTFKGAVNARLPQSPGKRFAFIDFKTAEEAARTREEMQNVQIDGHKVKLYFANSAQQQEEAVRNPHVI